MSDVRAIAIAALLLVAGCNNPVESRSVLLPIDQVTAPDQVAPGTAAMVSVRVVSGGCRTFERLEVQQNVGGMTVTAHGRDAGSKQTACTDDVRYDVKTFQTLPLNTDPFLVVAREPDGSTLTKTVRVQ